MVFGISFYYNTNSTKYRLWTNRLIIRNWRNFAHFQISKGRDILMKVRCPAPRQHTETPWLFASRGDVNDQNKRKLIILKDIFMNCVTNVTLHISLISDEVGELTRVNFNLLNQAPTQGSKGSLLKTPGRVLALLHQPSLLSKLHLGRHWRLRLLGSGRTLVTTLLSGQSHRSLSRNRERFGVTYSNGIWYFVLL